MTPSLSPETADTVSKPTEHHRYVWRGIGISITYTPDRFGLSGTAYQFDSLEVDADDAIPLPITETGYRSLHPPAGMIEAGGGPVACVSRWLEEASLSTAWKLTEAGLRQGNLF